MHILRPNSPICTYSSSRHLGMNPGLAPVVRSRYVLIMMISPYGHHSQLPLRQLLYCNRTSMNRAATVKQIRQHVNAVVSAYRCVFLALESQSIQQMIGKVKHEAFGMIYLLESTRVTNRSLLILAHLLQLTTLHYFYFHPSFPSLLNFSFFQYYFTNCLAYLVHISPPSPTSVYSLIFMPLLLLLLIGIRIRPHYVLTKAVAVFTFLLPGIFIRLMTEIVGLRSAVGFWVYLGSLCAVITILLSAVIWYLNGRMQRLLDILCIVALQLQANVYVLLSLLVVRSMFYLVLCLTEPPSTMERLKRGHQLGCFLVLISTLFLSDCLLNSISFALILASLPVYFAFQLVIQTPDAYALLPFLDDPPVQVQFFSSIEDHITSCLLLHCRCKSIFQVEKIVPEQLQKWFLAFEEEQLRCKEGFQAGVDFASACMDHYNGKLTGLVRLYEEKPRSVVEELKVYVICRKYEQKMQRERGNEKSYLNMHEELAVFHEDLLSIVHNIRSFWINIQDFDGTEKFLNNIISVSESIKAIRSAYDDYLLRYDQSDDFKYVFQLFRSIILNEKANCDELNPSDTKMFIVTVNGSIIRTNHTFAQYISRPKREIIGISMDVFIPEDYREAHQAWCDKYIQQPDGREREIMFVRSKCGVELLKMKHSIIAKFDVGIEIFTLMWADKKINEQFPILISRVNLRVVGWADAFVSLLQMNKKPEQLPQLNMHQVFTQFNPHLKEGMAKDIEPQPAFLAQFTSFNTQLPQLEYQVLPSRAGDSYVKAVFRVRQKRNEEKDGATKPKKQYDETAKVDTHRTPELQQKKKDQEPQFTLPYMLLLAFAALYILSAVINSRYLDSFTKCTQSHQFYTLYLSDILYCYGASIGRNQLPEIKQLWIQGYGDFSSSFPILDHFQQIDRSFDNATLFANVNTFGLQLASDISKGVDALRNLNSLMVLVMVGFIVYACVDLVFTARFALRVEDKVGSMILHFLRIDREDIKQVLLVIDNYCEQVLNVALPPQQEEGHNETGDISAMTLRFREESNRSSSIMSLNATSRVSLKAEGQRRKSENSRRRVSLGNITAKFAKISKLSVFAKTQIPFQANLSRKEEIERFERKTKTIGFFLKSNAKLVILMSFYGIAVLILLCVSTSYTSKLLQYFETILKIDSQFKLVRITLLESTLQVFSKQGSNGILSVTTITEDIGKQLLTLPSDFSIFETKFSFLLLNNACSVVANHLCQTLINQSYGLNIVNQQIADYYRTATSAALQAKSDSNELLTLYLAIITSLIGEFQATAEKFRISAANSCANLAMAGSALILFCLGLQKIVLHDVQRKIVSTKELFKIMPKQIKKQSMEVAQSKIIPRQY